MKTSEVKKSWKIQGKPGSLRAFVKTLSKEKQDEFRAAKLAAACKPKPQARTNRASVPVAKPKKSKGSED